MESVPRQLNDYESMLATSTVNFAIHLSLPRDSASAASALREAWSRTVGDYAFLQCRLAKRAGDMGMLGQRYDLVKLDAPPVDVVQLRFEPPAEEAQLVRELQKIGTTKLRVEEATYFVSCAVDPEQHLVDGTPGFSSATVVVSLNHALSDGRSALQIAHRFLEHVQALIERTEVDAVSPSSPHPAIDLQAAILGADYGASEPAAPECYPDLPAVRAALAAENGAVAGAPLLPPEAAQGLPRDSADGSASTIDCVHVRLSAKDTARLRASCRERGASVQGAVTVASILARLALLRRVLPVTAVVQVPADIRALADVSRTASLCGSAGLWHVTRVCGNDGLLEAARAATEAVRAAAKSAQPREWLRRLFHAPAELPPFSLMMSSVGIAPVEKMYGSLHVEELLFFGGALESENPAHTARQATMSHAISFAGQLQLMFNFTTPGVELSFAEESGRLIKAALLAMAFAPSEGDVNVSSFMEGSLLRGYPDRLSEHEKFYTCL